MQLLRQLILRIGRERILGRVRSLPDQLSFQKKVLRSRTGSSGEALLPVFKEQATTCQATTCRQGLRQGVGVASWSRDPKVWNFKEVSWEGAWASGEITALEASGFQHSEVLSKHQLASAQGPTHKWVLSAEPVTPQESGGLMAPKNDRERTQCLFSICEELACREPWK